MRSVLFLASLLLVLCATSVRAQMPVSPLTITETKIVRFAPTLPIGGYAQEGSCGSESLMVTRPGAWRCSVANAIHDPCFPLPKNHGQLVCDADPAPKAEGFVLKLMKPLPESPHLDRKPEPWIFRLADNSICNATLSANGHPRRWKCTIYIRDQVRPDGVVTLLTPGKIWMADKFPGSAIGTQDAKPEKIPVKMIWQ
jgi:hypothetical protein